MREGPRWEGGRAAREFHVSRDEVLQDIFLSVQSIEGKAARFGGKGALGTEGGRTATVHERSPGVSQWSIAASFFECAEYISESWGKSPLEKK